MFCALVKWPCRLNINQHNKFLVLFFRDAAVETPSEEFDFQSKLKEFDKEHEEEDDEAGDTPQPLTTTNGATSTSYDKDDFFDQ